MEAVEDRLRRRSSALSISTCATEYIYELRGHSAAVRDVRFCHNDKHIITASDDGTLRLWDTGSSSCIGRFAEHEDGQAVTAIDLNQEESRVLSSSWDKELKLCDLETGQLCWSAKHESMLTGCVLGSSSPGRARLALASGNNGTMCMWDIDKESSKPLHTFTGHSSTATACQVNVDRNIAVTTSMDMTAKVWDLRMPHRCLITLKNHINVVCHCHLTKCGRYLLTSGYDRLAYLTDISLGEFRSSGAVALAHHEGCVGSCRFSSKGNYMVTCGYDNVFAVWNRQDCAMHYKIKNGHENWIMAADFSSDEVWVATASKDCRVRVWSVASAPKETYQDPKKMLGLNVQQCVRCQREFSALDTGNLVVIGEEQAGWCVLCRLKQPSRVYAIP